MTGKEFLEEMANENKLPHRFDTQDQFLAELIEKYAEAKRQDDEQVNYIKENFTKHTVYGTQFFLKNFPEETKTEMEIAKLVDIAVKDNYGSTTKEMKAFSSEMESACGFENGFKKALEYVGLIAID